MNIEKLDQTRDYGTIFGHSTEKFEQDGRRYNASGFLVRSEPAPPKEEASEGKAQSTDEAALQEARDFLKSCLSAGALPRESVLRQAENLDVSLESVHEAAKELCRDYSSGKRGEQIRTWKLKE